MPKQFDQVILLNADEARRLARATDANNVMPLLRQSGPGARPARRFAGDPTFLFLANLRYPRECARIAFVPAASDAAVPGLRPARTTNGAGRELRELGERLGRAVSFLDYVEDLNALCSSIAGMVVPLLFGSGVKNLDYYLDEFTFRFNRRGLLFRLVLDTALNVARNAAADFGN
jgi:hypothetical protein